MKVGRGLAGAISMLLLLNTATWSSGLAAQEVLESGAYEIRWFAEGPLPAGVEEWFGAATVDSLVDEERRVDVYLVTGDEVLSPKLRGNEPRLELKGRTAARSIKACEATGVLESWTKWEWDYLGSPDEDAVREAFLTADDDRVAVSKIRRRAKFAFEPGGKKQVEVKDRLDLGGTLELTEGVVAGKPFWTVAVDLYLFEEDEVLVSEVSRLLCSVLDGFPATLGEGHSQGYAGWLREEAP